MPEKREETVERAGDHPGPCPIVECGEAGPADTLPTRRRILNWIVATSLGALIVSILYPVVRFIVPPATAAESSARSVTLDYGGGEIPPDSGRIFKFGSEPGIVLRTPTGDLRAFSAVCTHLSCTVQYREDLPHIWCACHNGHYDLNGVNIAGPPPRPLERYDVRERGDRLVVRRLG